MLRDAMLDTARRVVSARRVVQYQNEIGVLAHLWYNALTTGLGTQTLGEEYCDLFQIDPRGAAPGATRRWALVFLDAFAQPAMRRVRVRARAAADRRDRGDVRPRAGDDVETVRADDDETPERDRVRDVQHETHLSRILDLVRKSRPEVKRRDRRDHRER